VSPSEGVVLSTVFTMERSALLIVEVGVIGVLVACTAIVELAILFAG
jgi:hypothetical protein